MSKYDTGSTRGFVNACGRLTLSTGRNAHFNVLRDWNGTETLTLFEAGRFCAGDRYKVVGGCGTFDPGTEVNLLSARNHRALGYYTAKAAYPATAEGMLKLKKDLDGASTVHFGTWD